MTDASDEDLMPLLEDDAEQDQPSSESIWKVLIVDDDEDVHQATKFALANTPILHRDLLFLHAHSAAEAIHLLKSETDIAVILLDVVMESEDAGLKLVRIIREDLDITEARIILRTGQPGYAPEIDAIRDYDINDYKTKSELTRTKLFATLTTAIRSYDQLRRLDASRAGLAQIVQASNQLMVQHGLQSFAEGVLIQIASMIGVSPEGLVCAGSGPGKDGMAPDFRVIAAAGNFAHLMQGQVADIGDPHIVQCLTECLAQRRNLLDRHSVTLFIAGQDGADFSAFVYA